MSSDYNITGILRNNRIAKGISTLITTLAASYLCTFGSIPAAYAAQKHTAPKQTLEEIATEDVPLVPLVKPGELKKKKKVKKKPAEDDEVLELVPLVPPSIEKHQLRLPGPFSAIEIQPLEVNIMGGFYDADMKQFKRRLDINKDGTLDHDLYIEFGEKPDEFLVWLSEIGTNKIIKPVFNKANKDLMKGIAGWPGSEKRNFYVVFEYVSDPAPSISEVKCVESIKIPSSVLEQDIIGYDKVDDLVACDLKKGCRFITERPDSELVRIRVRQVKNYFQEGKNAIEEDVIKTRDGEIGKKRGPTDIYSKEDYKLYIIRLAGEARRRFRMYDEIVGKKHTQDLLLNSVIERQIDRETQKAIAWIDNYRASDERLAIKRRKLEQKAAEENARTTGNKQDKKPDTYARKRNEPDYDAADIRNLSLEVPAVQVTQVQEQPRRFYETWWFWTIVGAAVTGAAVTGGILGSQGGGADSPRPQPGLTPGDGHYFGR